MDYILYVSGIAAMALALAGGAVVCLLYRARSASLKVRLDKEYGERKDAGRSD